jgi:hypothetical protein
MLTALNPLEAARSKLSHYYAYTDHIPDVTSYARKLNSARGLSRSTKAVSRQKLHRMAQGPLLTNDKIQLSVRDSRFGALGLTIPREEDILRLAGHCI